MAHAHDEQTSRGEEVFAALTRVLRGFKRMALGAPVDGPTLGILHDIHLRGPVRLSDVAACVGLDASTVSRHVAGLERDGYVVREPDPADGRASRLALTESGRAVMVEAIERRRALVGAALHDWTAADREVLQRLLDRMADDIERVSTTPAAPAAISVPRQEQPA